MKPRRRIRYAGKNPRQFSDKYKEHDPVRYAADVARILEAGKTLAGTHRPILVSEIISLLNPQPGQTLVDATLGYGGHTAELLPLLRPGGRLLGLDADPIELPKTEARLRNQGFDQESFRVRQGNFAGISAALAEFGWGEVDGVLADLGVSSMQIDDPMRGFTFKQEGPLDLRFNPHRGISAAAWLARVTPVKLARALLENADVPRAEIMARGIIDAGAAAPWIGTVQLAEGIRRILATGVGDNSNRVAADDVVRRVFQAIRIEVNDEFSALEAFLRTVSGCLKSGSRVVVLTFHSGEDRRVKHAFKAGRREGTWSEIAEELIRPSPEEVRANPRASSAKLRWATRA